MPAARLDAGQHLMLTIAYMIFALAGHGGDYSAPALALGISRCKKRPAIAHARFHTPAAGTFDLTPLFPIYAFTLFSPATIARRRRAGEPSAGLIAPTAAATLNDMRELVRDIMRYFLSL